MKILITGVAGFIGSNLAQVLLKKNYEIFGIDNFITGSKRNIGPMLSNKQFHFFSNDICTFNFNELPACDVVYHLASPASPVQYKKFPIETLTTNSEGTQKVLKYVEDNKNIIFVLASTSEVYGDPQIHPQKETYWGNVNPNGVRSCYDEGKRFAEALTFAYFRKYKIDARIARIFNTYGPNMEKDDGRVISNFIMQSLLHKPITLYGTGKQTRSFCYISDMIEALVSIGTKKNITGEVINIGNPHELSITKLATLIKQLTKSSSQISHEPIDEDDPKKRNPDISKAKQLLDWSPKISLEQGIIKTIEYFRACL
jgi:nucleoside-diphosphate-sugar epimerase